MILTFIIIATLVIFFMNKQMDKFCNQKEIPEEKQPKIFRTTNILTTILLISSFVEFIFT
ncbi:hypothetical protein OEV98_02900 [Caldibacillus lycopersici]|uniref:Uncharacterized protein n=1 Tax=Perspicuibacillus lycopersici TaxID=1325689 RepID=A0AAE3IQV6_9BACI|nr:hypothetical protein [Perspicuibacillus lycopersici]MCU9612512.1 hypothetical protein [Perspicuibacillus lycopersici]